MRSGVQSHLARGARRAAWATAGALLLGVGLAFLTGAAWLVLEALRGPAFAALVIGLVYAGAGLLAFGLGARRARCNLPPPPAEEQGERVFERMAVAFGEGFRAGKAMRR